jgi:glutamyl/glutaminyl-tRNA synthetase
LDLLPSTACQRYIAELLGLDRFLEVRFVHHELVVGADGHKLSKSAGSSSLQAMRAAGEGPETLYTQAAVLIARVL